MQNCNVEGNGIRDTVSAANLVQQVQFNGLTVRAPEQAVPARLVRRHGEIASNEEYVLCTALLRVAY